MSAFRKLIQKNRKEYKRLRPVFCKPINEYVYFNAHGFKHLRFHTDGTPRNPAQVFKRMRLLEDVSDILLSVENIEQYRYYGPLTGIEDANSKKGIQYWSFISYVESQKQSIRVVVRKIGDGKIHFFSVIPK